MKNSKTYAKRTSKRGQRGYTLLEYCAGAAILLAIVWGGMTTLGGQMNDYFGRIGTWLSNTQIPTTTTNP